MPVKPANRAQTSAKAPRQSRPPSSRPPKTSDPKEAPPGAFPWLHESLRQFAVPVESLKPDPTNARLHSKKNLKAIEDSLGRFGQMLPILARTDGTVIAGNGRLATILSRDLPTSPGSKDLARWSHVAVVRFEGSLESAKALGLVDNRTSELATWDFEVLSEGLRVLISHEFDISGLGWEEHEFKPLLDANWNPAPRTDGGLDVSRSHAHSVTFTDAQWALLEKCREKLSKLGGGRVDRSMAEVVTAALEAFLGGSK